jgi:hypothetical protein
MLMNHVKTLGQHTCTFIMHIRDRVNTRERVARHLNEITPAAVQEALTYEFEQVQGQIVDNVTGVVKGTVEQLEKELHYELTEICREKHLMQRDRQKAIQEMEAARAILTRVERLEENERLTSRVSTEKKDCIYPLSSYPPMDADEELVRKAVISLSASIKVIERQLTYEGDPYDFVLYVALEANKVAQMHKLSANQQWELVLNALPVDPKRNYYSMTKDIHELYQVISVLAPKILTISDLEKAVGS